MSANTDVMRAHEWATNAHMIADVAKLGYIEGRVLDATYGEHGGFWKEWRPDDLTTNDLNAKADFQYDFRFLPPSWKGSCQFTTVVYDPPYKLNGTPADDDMDARYGTGERLNIAGRLAMIVDGAVECLSVTRRWLLVKCQDQVVSGKVFWQTHLLHNELADRGATLVDRFDYLSSPRVQPAGWSGRPTDGKRKTFKTKPEAEAYVDGDGCVVDLNRPQQHARANYSTLMVFGG